ncbi:hypothetical protein D1007_54998 [Hordeum vulgare]|nr:hypothetical protein D1007_54998 [Hordeum vulgare]
MFRGEYLWQTAIARKWPLAGFRKRWPGPIPRGSARRRFQALYVSENLVPSGGEIDELVGHTYLYLKEQLERLAVPPSSILHGTIIDQFIACGRTGEKAHELASNIWIAVIDNLEENQQTFMLLKHLAQEGDFFLPFPYSRSYKVLWRVFDKLFTDFRDCFSGADYHEALAGAKSSEDDTNLLADEDMIARVEAMKKRIDDPLHHFEGGTDVDGPYEPEEEEEAAEEVEGIITGSQRKRPTTGSHASLDQIMEEDWLPSFDEESNPNDLSEQDNDGA